MRKQRIIGTSVIALPDELVPKPGTLTDPAPLAQFLDQAGLLCVATLGIGDRVRRREIIEVEWTVTHSVAEVKAWPLPHDCDDCRDGKIRAIARLQEAPGTHVALGRLVYDDWIYSKGEAGLIQGPVKIPYPTPCGLCHEGMGVGTIAAVVESAGAVHWNCHVDATVAPPEA